MNSAENPTLQNHIFNAETVEHDMAVLQNCILELESKLKIKDEYLKIKDEYLKIKDEYLKIKDEDLKKQSDQINILHEQLRLAVNNRFGKKSEKYSKDESDEDIQGCLFEVPSVSVTEKKEVEKADAEITVASHTRKKKGRKPLPEDLPREEVIHDLADEDKCCKDCGSALCKIGEDRSEQLLYIPAQLKVLVHVRYKYACKPCQGNVAVAPLPKLPIPKSIATAELLTQIIVAKFEHHLPLYRQEKIFKNIGVDIPRNTTSVWLGKCATLCKPIVDIMTEHIRSGNYTNADETPLKVINQGKHKNKPKLSKSYMFVYVGGTRESPASAINIIFDYQPTRAGYSAKEFLEGFKGYLQTDAFSGYNVFADNADVKQVACWAHARRGFMDIVKITKTKGLAHEAMEYIQDLYDIEQDAKEHKLTAIERKRLREEKSESILKRFKPWLELILVSTPPKSKIGKSINYTLKNWEGLNKFLEDGILEIDNNRAENTIRPFALGRKNWLFSANEEGAKSSAILYSLVETCRANKVNTINYFNHILKRLPYCETKEDYEALIPHKIKKSLAG